MRARKEILDAVGCQPTRRLSYDEAQNEADRFRRPVQTQDCARGEHLYETGRRNCRLCGEDY